MTMISRNGSGLLIYEEQEGRGIGLMAKLQTYQLQDQGLDTLQANEQLGLKGDYREYRLPVEILKVLGVARVRLLSNNLDKVSALLHGGIEVIERIPCEADSGPDAEEYLKTYLRTKKEKFGHLLSS
jgi:GTP cyclohydrolase II